MLCSHGKSDCSCSILPLNSTYLGSTTYAPQLRAVLVQQLWGLICPLHHLFKWLWKSIHIGIAIQRCGSLGPSLNLALQCYLSSQQSWNTYQNFGLVSHTGLPCWSSAVLLLRCNSPGPGPPSWSTSPMWAGCLFQVQEAGPQWHVAAYRALFVLLLQKEAAKAGHIILT